MNGYQDNSSRKNACRSGMPLMSCPVAGISGNRCINTAPPTCPPEIPCAGSVHPVSENGAFCRRGQKSDLPARIRRQEETGPPQTFLGGGNYPVGMGYVPIQSWAAAVCAGNCIQAGNYFSGSGSAVYDGRCLLMNETARKLMKRIDDASFAMDDVILYLDTHPDDRNALNYYRYVVALRKEAVKAYEASFGPLTIEDADDACTWSWLTERWPWEGEV